MFVNKLTDDELIFNLLNCNYSNSCYFSDEAFCILNVICSESKNGEWTFMVRFLKNWKAEA